MKKLILAVMILLIGFGISAQTISLEEVRTLALLNSRSLAKTNLNIQNLALNDRSRNFQYLPSLSLGANASMALWNASNATLTPTPAESFDIRISASVTESISFKSGRGIIERAID